MTQLSVVNGENIAVTVDAALAADSKVTINGFVMAGRFGQAPKLIVCHNGTLYFETYSMGCPDGTRTRPIYIKVGATVKVEIDA